MLRLVKSTRPRSGETFFPSGSRSRRFVKLHDGWYFLTRENPTPVGPYKDCKSALKVANDYSEFANVAGPSELENLSNYLSGNHSRTA